MRAVRASFLALLLCAAAVALALVARAEVAVPQLTGRVVDLTGTLGSDTITRLSDKLQAFEARKGSQIAVLIVPTTQPETIEQFSIRVAEAWKIGRKKIDDGAILLVAKGDRKLRIEVGYGLEGALPDVTAKRIIDEIITPKFKAGDFSGGIDAGTDRMIAVIDGEPLPAPEPQHEWPAPESLDQLSGWAIPAIVAVLAFNGVLRAALGGMPLRTDAWQVDCVTGGLQMLEGSIGTLPLTADERPGAKAFVAAYRASYGADSNPSSEASLNYTALHLVVQAMQLAGSVSEPAAIRAQLDAAAKALPDAVNPNDLNGVDEKGGSELNTVVGVVEGGKMKAMRLKSL